MLTVIIFLVVLSVLVLAHELGHFWTAKRAGVKVEEFGIGFPPRLVTWRRGETLYSINLILFGGYVKIFGEDEAQKDEPCAFGSLPVGRRAKILAAGVAMNVVLAVVLLSVVAGLGQPTVVTEANAARARNVQVMVLQVVPGSPAEEAGILPGDAVLRAEAADKELAVKADEELASFLAEHVGEEVVLMIMRAGEVVEARAALRKDPAPGEGALGVALARVGTVKVPVWRAPAEGVQNTVLMTLTLGEGLRQIGERVASGEGVGGSLAGPVGIATLTGDAARLGVVFLLQFTAFLSINLAVLNILPFPALDGGRLVFLAIEKVRGAPVTPAIERTTHGLGFAALILFIVWITLKDIERLL